MAVRVLHMPATEHEVRPATASTQPGELRWDGHMSDGVAATYGPTPMAFLSATPEGLLLSGNRGTFQVPRSAVTKVGRGKMYPWFFRGVRIRHTISKYPADLQFQPMDAHWREVVAQLKALGYPA